MADQAPPAAPADVANPAQQQQQQGGTGFLQQMMRLFSYWMMIQVALSFIWPKTPSTTNNMNDNNEQVMMSEDGSPESLDSLIRNEYDSSSGEGSSGEIVSKSNNNNNNNKQIKKTAPRPMPKFLRPHWIPNQFGRLSYYLLEDNADHEALRNKKTREEDAIHLHTFDNVQHSENAEEMVKNVTIDLSACAARNCSLFVHVLYSPNRVTGGYYGTEPSTVALPFVRYERIRRTQLRNLFGGSDENINNKTLLLEDASTKQEEETEIIKSEKEAAATTTTTKSSIEKQFMSPEELKKKEKDSEKDNRKDLPVSTNTKPAEEDSNNNDKELSSSSTSSTHFVIATIPPSIYVNIIADWTRWDTKSLPLPVQPHIRSLGVAKKRLNEEYAPTLHINEFWILDEYRTAFNKTSAKEVNITLSTAPLSLYKFMMYVTFSHQQESQKEWGLQSTQGMDEIKRMLLETEPWLLVVTMVVTLLHTLFEYLTFSSDVQFWRGKKNFRGLSVRTVGLNCYFQTVIFLYLFDGNETSYSVLIPSGIGVLIEYWKLKKTFVFEEVDHTAKKNDENEDEEKETDEKNGEKKEKKQSKEQHIVIPPKWQFWKHYTVKQDSSYDKTTRSFDDQAMKWLFYIMTPCLLGYSVYSAIYDQHKGWYSFLIRVQVRFIYWTGFIQMTPQIFINYKKKSVGQLPWKAFVYKALNTFIDDLFAFVIKMPTMHRLAVFRDDLVFMILLYQRWIYPVDKTRSGVDGADVDVEEEEGEGEEKKTAIEDKKKEKEEKEPKEKEEAVLDQEKKEEKKEIDKLD